MIDYDDEETTNPLRVVSPEVIDMFCREAVVLSEEKLRNELMTVDSFSYRLLKLIQKYKMALHNQMVHTTKEDKRHKCWICQKSFAFKRRLQDHMNTHTGRRSY